MSREDRAKQFASFNPLKGLNKVLRLKEYEHDKILKGDLSEEQIEAISQTLKSIKEGDVVEICYYHDGYYLKEKGNCKLNFDRKIVIMQNKQINFDSIYEINIFDKKN